MKFSLSTNWCNRRIESGEEIADKAPALAAFRPARKEETAGE